MYNLDFLYEYISEYKTVGAILPSSKKLARRMVENINFDNCEVIVEYGPGTGVFTEEILRKRKNINTKILLIEYNTKFYNILKERYKNEENLFIVNDSAENLNKYLDKYKLRDVNYIISGLPFASIDKEVSKKILSNTNKILGRNGEFITFQYTLLKKDMIQNYFDSIIISKELLNVPPAYVFKCCNK